MRHTLRSWIPPGLVRHYEGVKLFLARKKNRKLSAREVFSKVYKNNEWGGAPGTYCSGYGSCEFHAVQYAAMVNAFIQSQEIKEVVDLGCGDFAVGSKLELAQVSYTGIDIVEELIQSNREHFDSDNVRFLCLDIITDDLPSGELCLIRQVLQHLSNAQIATILGKLGKYKYVLITEHYPPPSKCVIPNKDKPHGPDTRISDNSAVYLDLPPFNMRLSHIMLEVPVTSSTDVDGTIRTFLIEN